MEIPIPQPTNLQSQSPLFNRIPPEVRNQIFQFALTSYEDTARKYRPNAYHYRPGFTCALRIDTDLLLTCRRIYWETFSLPARINEHTSWFGRPPPMNLKKNPVAINDSLGAVFRRRHLRTVHIFVQQAHLEGPGFAGFTGLWQYACPTTLIITLRHNDWWWWEERKPLKLDPKQVGQASTVNHSRPSDPFAPRSWGFQLSKVKGLEKLQLELETVEATKRVELDAIVDRAEGWAFPLGDERVLRLNKSKTKRDGWVGVRLDEENEAGKDAEDILNKIEEKQRRKELGLPRHDPDNASLTSTRSSDTGDIPWVSEDEEGDGIEPSSAANEPSTNVDAEDLALTPDSAAPGDSHPASEQQQTGDVDMPNASSNPVGLLTKPLEVQRASSKLLEAAGVVFNDAGMVTGLPLDMTSKYYVVTLTWEAQPL